MKEKASLSITFTRNQFERCGDTKLTDEAWDVIKNNTLSISLPHAEELIVDHIIPCEPWVIPAMVISEVGERGLLKDNPFVSDEKKKLNIKVTNADGDEIELTDDVRRKIVEYMLNN